MRMFRVRELDSMRMELRLILRVALSLAVVAFAPQRVPAQGDALGKALAQNRYALALQGNKISGAGASVLEKAASDTQFVLIGEDHGIAQIPSFSASVFEMLAPQGYHTLAIETGPLATRELLKDAEQKDGARLVHEFEQKYPASIAFYNWKEEFAFLQRCAAAAPAGKFRLWGLDQELMGSAGPILHEILAQNLPPDIHQSAEHLLQENDAAYAEAAKTGDPRQLFLFSAKQDELNVFRDLLGKEGPPAAASLFDSLLESREIYAKNGTGEYYASNRQRSLLMKSLFMADYNAALASEGKPPKVMIKIGGYHAFIGINMLHNHDIGNLAAELAEGNHAKSLHILILGVKGTQLQFAGIGRPPQPAPLDLHDKKQSDFTFLQPMFDTALPDSWTLYDLRPLRPQFGSLGKIEPEMERMIFGYDFLIMIPDPVASHPIE